MKGSEKERRLEEAVKGHKEEGSRMREGSKILKDAAKGGEWDNRKLIKQR